MEVVETNVESSQKPRINRFDNLKGLAIVLVVMGHLVELFAGLSYYSVFKHMIYIFHMPVFFFVSGYLSKVDKNLPKKAFRGLFIPYLIFNFLWIVFAMIVLGKGFPKFPFFIPETGLWFLLSLFIMRTILPVLDKIKHVFLISIVLALFVGILNLPENFLAISRTLCFLPGFILGYYFKEIELGEVKSFTSKLLHKIKNFITTYKYLVFGLLILFFIAIFFSTLDISNAPFAFIKSYKQMHMRISLGMFIRFLVISSGLLIVIVLYYLMTNKKTFLTKLGINSMAIYILHFYFVKFMGEYLLNSSFSEFFENPYYVGIYIIVSTVILTYILSRDFVSVGINKIIEKVNGIFGL
ncbi:MAG: acyltransferase family protein [Methanobrevibacter sp.]|nr:acyltransferase family protein [Candidatus Methanovirga australis]